MPEPAIRLPLAAAVAGLTVCLALVTTIAIDAGRGQTPSAPSFNREVAPILFSKCAACHRPGDVGPMSLLTYQVASMWAPFIKEKVQAREMPPWPADPRYGRFRNEHRLTDAEAAILSAWADAGAPEGTGAAPLPPTFLDGWTSQMDRPPDLVIDAPVDFELPAEGVVPEFTVWSKVPFDKDRFIEAIELRPVTRAVFHHASIFRGRLPRGVTLGRGQLWPGGATVDGIPVARNQAAPLRSSMASGQPLVFYVPSGGFLRLPPGIAKRIDANEYFMWTFHLATNGRPTRVAARVGLWFSKERVRNEVVTWTVTDQVEVNGKRVERDAQGPRLPPIRPHEQSYTVVGTMRVTRPLTLYALWPHMHSRGRDITFVLQDERGREQVLLQVPRYRFQWQFTYELTAPLRVEAGSTIKAIAHYDNSAGNDENPDPAAEVTWGPLATNEMFDPFLELAYEKQAPALLDLSQ